MEKVTIDEVSELETNPAESLRRPIGDTLGTTDVSINHYELAPGESLSGGLHAHHDQEEIFVVLEGTAAFDVGPERDRIDVTAGEAIRSRRATTRRDGTRAPTDSSCWRSARPAAPRTSTRTSTAGRVAARRSTPSTWKTVRPSTPVRSVETNSGPT